MTTRRVHVGLLKKFCGEPLAEMVPLLPICHGHACLEPTTVTKSRLARDRPKVLVHWKGHAAVDTTWMPLGEFHTLPIVPARG
jgi:hypothetical protein